MFSLKFLVFLLLCFMTQMCHWIRLLYISRKKSW